MKLIIDIPKANYEKMKIMDEKGTLENPYLMAIAQGTPIPKEQEPKTGYWEWVQYDGNPNIGNWHCSECGSIVIECVSKEKKGGIPLYKYCPQCGAKIE